MLELLGMLKSSVKKLDGFVLDILNYSRNARVQVESEKIDFNELVSDIVRDLRFMNAGNSNVDITVDVSENAILHSDKSRIKMVVSNLLANALRYHDPQKADPYVNISIQPHDAGVIISIQDNGIGISKDKHEKVFDMFYRASVMSEGTGIGLYIVKETVEKLNGIITLDSEPGRGSDFRVYLPTINNKTQKK